MKRSNDALRYLQDQMPARRELIESGRVRVTPPVEIRRRLAKLLSEGFPRSLPPAPMGDLEGNETMTIGGCRGHVCSVCGDPIQDDAALSVEYLYSTGTYHFHGQCNDLWLEERQRPVKRTKSL